MAMALIMIPIWKRENSLELRQSCCLNFLASSIIMATHVRHLRSTTVHSENADNMLARKGAIKPGAAASKLGVRSALGNIAVNQQRSKPAASGPIKDLIQKPTRLTKQKGTTSLQSLRQGKLVPAIIKRTYP